MTDGWTVQGRTLILLTASLFTAACALVDETAVDGGERNSGCADLPVAADPSEAGWDPAGFEQLRGLAGEADASAVMIVTGGEVVFSYGATDRPMFLASVRKSVLSALIGIAVEEGVLELDETVVRWGIDDDPPLMESEREATLRDLISSRSGVYLPTAAESPRMRDNRPERGSREPGSFWFYNNWDFNVAGAIFERATRKSIFLAFQHFIADPLCMQDFDAYEHTWYLYTDTAPRYPAYHMALSARDLARFGMLYLQDGVWAGERILPRRWVDESTAPISATQEEPELASGYGYMWWVTADVPAGRSGQMLAGSYTAMGSGGQRMTVLPAIDTVILARADTKPGGIGASAFRDTTLWQAFVEAALALRRDPQTL